MKIFFRKRRPSLNNILGITRLKRRGNKAIREMTSGCFGIFFLFAAIGSIGQCGKTAVPTSQPQQTIETKNGIPLTEEQIRERNAYIVRAQNKKRKREQAELRRSQAQIAAAQAQAQAFQWQQAARNSANQQAAAQRRSPFASNPELDADLNQPASQNEPPPVVLGWNGSAPTGEPAGVVESTHRVEPTKEDLENYVPPAIYGNLPPQTTGTRVFKPQFSSGGVPSSQPSNFGTYGTYGTVGTPFGVRGAGPETTRRGPDGAPYNVRVRGYLRSDGTYVRSHRRRSPRR